MGRCHIVILYVLLTEKDNHIFLGKILHTTKPTSVMSRENKRVKLARTLPGSTRSASGVGKPGQPDEKWAT